MGLPFVESACVHRSAQYKDSETDRRNRRDPCVHVSKANPFWTNSMPAHCRFLLMFIGNHF